MQSLRKPAWASLPVHSNYNQIELWPSVDLSNTQPGIAAQGHSVLCAYVFMLLVPISSEIIHTISSLHTNPRGLKQRRQRGWLQRMDIRSVLFVQALTWLKQKVIRLHKSKSTLDSFLWNSSLLSVQVFFFFMSRGNVFFLVGFSHWNK